MKEKFLQLKEAWKLETMHLSNITTICENQNYTEIIKMGFKAVPWIIEDMKESPEFWFEALRKITNVDAVMPDHYGDLEKMTNDWLEYYDGGLKLRAKNEY